MTKKISMMKAIDYGSETNIIPLFKKIVFKEVLEEMNVTCIQSDFEADRVVASVAHRYKCPVISYDTDYFVFGVDYIPLPQLQRSAVPLNSQSGRFSKKFCINCKIFKHDAFLKNFSGFDRNSLPLLATLLGNDYIDKWVFRNFFLQLEIPETKKSFDQKKISQIIKWLCNETYESALKKVLDSMERPSISRKIMAVVNIYSDLNVNIEQYLPLGLRNSTDVNNFVVSDNMNSKKGVENEATDDVLHSGPDNEEVILNKISLKNIEESSDEDLDDTTDKFIEPCVIDILTLKTYFTSPQMEHRHLKASHLISVPLIKVISKLLLGNCDQEISIWTKNDNANVQRNIQRSLFNLSDTKIITNLENVPTLTIDQRKALFLECLSMPPEFCLDSFPNNWKLYVCAIIYWLQNKLNNGSEPVVQECHLVSICMCMISVNLVYSKVGHFNKQEYCIKKYGRVRNQVRKIIDDGRIHVKADGHIDELDKISEIDINQSSSSQDGSDKCIPSDSILSIIKSLTLEDCVAVYPKIDRLRKVDKNFKTKKVSFSLIDVHVFAEFQSILYHVMLLNSLLAFPFQKPKISFLYSGTFICNFCYDFKEAKNRDTYLKSFLEYSPKIKDLFNKMYSLMTKAAPSLLSQQNKVKPSTEKKVPSQSRVENVEYVGYNDKNNPFSLLSM